ncbi:unnamed protein product, partial [Rotaria sordida]
LIDEDDQYKHTISLHYSCELEPMLDVFQYDEQYEEKYKQIRITILDETNVNEDESSSSSSNSDEEEKQDDRVQSKYNFPVMIFAFVQP